MAVQHPPASAFHIAEMRSRSESTEHPSLCTLSASFMLGALGVFVVMLGNAIHDSAHVIILAAH